MAIKFYTLYSSFEDLLEYSFIIVHHHNYLGRLSQATLTLISPSQPATGQHRTTL